MKKESIDKVFVELELETDSKRQEFSLLTYKNEINTDSISIY